MSNNKIFKVEHEQLSDDDCFLSTLINVSENVFIEKMLLILERHDDIVKIDLADIFLNNYIRIPTLEDHIQKQYNTKTCNDLKPLIKNISWKDTRLLATEEHQVSNILSDILLNLEKNTQTNTYSYIDHDDDIINLIHQTDWAIKFHGDSRGFGIYKNVLLFFNTGQFNNSKIKHDVKNFISLIKGHINNE